MSTKSFGDATKSFGGSTNTVPIIKYISDDYQVLITDDIVISDGGNTITLPLIANANRPVKLINEGITNDTIDGNGEAVPNSTLLTPTEVRGFIKGSIIWLEI